MVKSMFKGSTIEIWQKDYINKEEWMVIEERDKNAEIIQIEHAYEDYFMVEVRRHGEIKVESKNYSDVNESNKVKKFLNTVEVNNERSE